MVFSLTTERLILDDMAAGDLTDIRRIARDPRVMKYVLIWLENDEQAASFIRHAIEESRRPDRKDYVLAVRVRETGEFAGFASVTIVPEEPGTGEVGCVLLPEYWKKGYASEVLRELLAFGFGRLSLHRMFAKCDELNLASAHTLEKSGLRYEGTAREHVWLRDHWRSSRYYGMLAGEFREKS